MAKASTNEIAKVLNRIQGHDNYTVIRDFFEISAIAVRNNVDYSKERDSYEQRYLSIVKKYRKEDLEVFVEALAVFQGWIYKAMNGDIPFRDFAGEIYMDSGTSNGKAGQFFTPYHVSHLMAECNFDKDKLKAEIAADPDHVITIAEPTCGAGGLIVAAAWRQIPGNPNGAGSPARAADGPGTRARPGRGSPEGGTRARAVDGR